MRPTRMRRPRAAGTASLLTPGHTSARSVLPSTAVTGASRRSRSRMPTPISPVDGRSAAPPRQVVEQGIVVAVRVADDADGGLASTRVRIQTQKVRCSRRSRGGENGR